MNALVQLMIIVGSISIVGGVIALIYLCSIRPKVQRSKNAERVRNFHRTKRQLR